MAERISARGRNRALLARQLLLERSGSGPRDGTRAPRRDASAVAAGAVRRAVVAAGRFRPRRAVSAPRPGGTRCAATTLRTTVHLSTTRDYLVLRPAVQQVLARSFSSSPFAKNLDGVDLEQVVAAGRAGALTYAADASRSGTGPCCPVPRTRPRVARLCRPDVDRAGGAGPAAGRVAGERAGGVHAGLHLARPASSARRPHPRSCSVRYLAAYGPASVADAQVWSGLTGLGAAADRARPPLVVLADDDGRELLDLPDAPRPDGRGRARIGPVRAGVRQPAALARRPVARDRRRAPARGSSSAAPCSSTATSPVRGSWCAGAARRRWPWRRSGRCGGPRRADVEREGACAAGLRRTGRRARAGDGRRHEALPAAAGRRPGRPTARRARSTTCTSPRRWPSR